MTPNPNDRAALLREMDQFAALAEIMGDDCSLLRRGAAALREEMAAREAERADRDLLPVDHVLVPTAKVFPYSLNHDCVELRPRYPAVCTHLHPTRAEAETCGGRALMRLRRGEEPWA